MRNSKIDPQHIASYLQEHPDFFNQHLELLENLTISHPADGNVVSLTGKQLELLRNKQHKLEQQLKSLIAIAKDNDIHASKIHKLSLMLLGTNSLEEAVFRLINVFKECFLIDFVALKIIADNHNPALDEFFVSPHHESLNYLNTELKQRKPRCGQLSMGQSQFLFAEAATQIKSYAVIPILFPDLSALLVLGSCDENRFHHTLGDLFLIRISEIVGTRLMTLLKS